MSYTATKQEVLDRGVPPDAFLDELVAWGKEAPDEIFAPPDSKDIYSSVVDELGPWQDDAHRRAAMLEVMRVLAGFESSWDWEEGGDTTNPNSGTPSTKEAGAWQVSADAMAFGPELKKLVQDRADSTNGIDFQRAMKADHPLAMEFIARLLRRTIRHNGPTRDHKIHPELSREAVDEFQALLSA